MVSPCPPDLQWSFSEVSQLAAALRFPRKDRYQLVVTQTTRAEVKNLQALPKRQETWLERPQFVQLQCFKNLRNEMCRSRGMTRIMG